MDENQPQRSHEQPRAGDRSNVDPPGSTGSNPLDQMATERCLSCDEKMIRLANGQCRNCELYEKDPAQILEQLRPILDENHLSLVLWALEVYVQERADQQHENWRILEHHLFAATLLAGEKESGSPANAHRLTIKQLRQEIAVLRGEVQQ